MNKPVKKHHVPIITIDGPSGTGKGTISHRLADHLHWHYLDSGALYRVLAWVVKTRGVDFDDVAAITALAHELRLSFEVDDEWNNHVYVDGYDISALIRTENCGQNASKISVMLDVREALLERQRAFAVLPGLVTDGRDMGTVVFPDADLKIFLFASTEERARRRFLQLQKTQKESTLAHVIDQLNERDARDSERAHSPLVPALNATQIDTTHLSIDDVLATVLGLAKAKWPELSGSQ